MSQTAERELVDYFRSARRERQQVVLEGFHALKHAVRFGAELHRVIAVDLGRLKALSDELAPDIAGCVVSAAEPVRRELFAQLSPNLPYTEVMAVARRPPVDVAAVLAEPRPAPVVLLEDPRDLGNLGAAVRVAAAADAAAVVTTGGQDPWAPAALRGAAGLHFALAVAQVQDPPASDRPLVAIDPDGDELDITRLTRRSLLAFGSERRGLSRGLLDACDMRVRIPMRSGVSSLNLATAVAAVLFGWRLASTTQQGSPSA